MRDSNSRTHHRITNTKVLLSIPKTQEMRNSLKDPGHTILPDRNNTHAYVADTETICDSRPRWNMTKANFIYYFISLW